MCSVNVGTAAAGICTFNERYIFIYGGQTDDFCTERIESFDVLDEERGWLLHQISESVIYLVKDLQIPMIQISTKEIIMVHDDRILITEIKQEGIVRSRVIHTEIYTYNYPSTQCYRGKAYWTENKHICCYDTIRKTCKFILS
jgi:hypothetical protein